ncbi:MAG TPA: GGDEF domain-containing protein, partial [Acidimicrobiales bacterium]|nr:GGDEF domain-containing protein [Acidimicrobiales bacterium]
FYSSRVVAGTPSRLVLAATQSVLLGKVGVGAEAWLGRVFLAGFAVVLSALAWLFIRAREGRDRSELAARVDLVTSVGNRRACDEQLARLLAENRRHGSGVGVVIVDVDHFKAINDRHGHAAGDGVLRQVAATISGCLRAEDFVGRWGGEEFMVLMGHTDAVGMVSAAERVRQALARAAFTTGGQTVSITISAGAALAGYCDNAADVLGRADSALYRAKAEGRDRVALAPSPTRHLTAV